MDSFLHTSTKHVTVESPANHHKEDATVDPQTGAVIEERKSKAERFFVARLDIFLLIYCCLSQVIKGLDQQNMSAAYVSGMKEDLKVQANEYNLFTTYFNIGYCLFVIPSQLLMTYVRPSYWLPFLEFSWGVLTIAFYKVTSVHQIYVLRAFVGMFEGSSFPGGMTLLMAWYTPRELAFRIGFFQSSQYVGSMMSSGLQAAIYRGLNGTGGIAGWRWMFIIDGTITLFIAILGFFCLPDYPTKKNKFAIWMRPRDVDMARSRVVRFRRSDQKKFTFKTLRVAVKQPLFYMIPVFYVSSMLAQQGYQYFNLFLKSLKNADGTAVWTVEKVNAIPIGGFAISCAVAWTTGFLSDKFRTRWILLLILSGIGLIPGIIMSIWTVPLGAKYCAYFLSYACIVTSPILFAWLSDLTPHIPEVRTLIVGMCIAGFYSQNSWANVLIWPASKAPHYPVAWKVSIGLWCFFICAVLFLRFLELRYIRPRNQQIAEEKYEAALREQQQAISPCDADTDEKADLHELRVQDVKIVGV
ncbi:major facilitator superfamily domain-containing protein [Naematelia encephala]|uniref:Major facilitator superfamily domain-containing protein n=1 Tax=Naematelia encephala TaxID=71784 RepID=A0A1Y2B6U0_9TREE|nr:major facilitator superfamily domain-containing protein [Naematelia encephala]